MTLEEAIAHLNDFIIQDPDPDFQDIADAIKLGIEAMKRIDSDRHQVVPLFLIKLPGETTD